MILPERRRAMLTAATIALAALVFVADLSLPLGIARAILYIPVVLATLWSPRRGDPLAAGALCTALALLGWALSPGAADVASWMEATNRGLALFALWVTAVGVHQEKATAWRLRDRERRLRLMTDALPALICFIDPGGKYIFANSRYRDWFGIDPATVPGRRVSDLIGAEAWQRVEPHARQALSGEAVSFEGRLPYADGIARDVHIDFVPHRDEGGTVSGLYAMISDVSGQKRVERDLRDREAALRAILDTASDGILTADASGRITSFNRAAERMFGITAAEAIGRDARTLFAVPEGEASQASPWSLLTGSSRRGAAIATELVGLRRGEHSIPVEVSAGEWSDGGPMLTLVLRDLTERKKLEAEVRQAQRMEAVGRFAGGIAHDFNNLLMGILGCCRIAARALRSGTQEEVQLDEIRAAAERGTALTRQLLAFSRRRDVEAETVVLDEVVRGVEALVRSLAGEDVRLVLELAAEGQAIVAARGQIEQILLNLVSNARDSMPKGGLLRIATAPIDCEEAGELVHGEGARGPHVALLVSDTGCGMDEETRARAFDPFYTTKRDTEGTGLGLSTVYGIVRQNGGHVHLESAPGAGTTLSIHFRRSAAPAKSVEAAPPPVAREAGGETILVVEDDRLVRAGVRHLLQEEGYAVLSAANGDEALAVCAAHPDPIQLLLTDIIMPGMGGAELARRVEQQKPGIRVLFMSALPNEVLVEQGRLEPGREAIQKPFDEAELTRRLRLILED